MSSIIDALKKSDNNRNSESGMNINQVKFNQTEPKPNRKWFWILVLILLMTAVGAYAWQQGWPSQIYQWLNSDQTEIEKPNSQVKQTNKPSSTNKLTPPDTGQVKAESTARKSANKSTVQNRPGNQPNEPTKLEGAASTPIEGEDENRQSAESLDEQLTVVQNNQDHSQVPDLSEYKPRKPLMQTSTEPSENQNQAPKKPIKQTPKNNKDALKAELTQDYLLIHQLDFEIRKNIPPIKLNIHIYDPLPENRLIMMNGVKYQVGDVIEEIVTVAEINQEGVVLMFEDIKFLVPK